MKLSKIFSTFLIFTFLLAGFFHPITAITQDLGRHFLLGKIILDTKQVPLVNLFSYTYPDFPFVNLHWLSEIIFYIIYQLVNYNGLLIFSTIIVLTAFSFIYFYKFKKKNILALAIVSLLYIKILFERTDIRPEIFSFLFLSFFVVILYKNREKFTRWIFILPLIELLWVNMHIYFIVGITVIGLFLVDGLAGAIRRGELMKFLQQDCLSRSEFRSKKILLATSAPILTVLLLSIFAALLNPNGLTGLLYPFHIFENYGYTIEENQNIFFLWNYSRKETIPYFAISAILLLTSLLFTFKKTKLIDWLLSIFFIILAASAVRNFPLFVFATFIPFVSSLSILISRIVIPARRFGEASPLGGKAGIHTDSGSPIKSGMTRFSSIILILFPIVILWQIVNVTSVKGLGFGVETGAKNGADFFLENNLRGPIFNNFDVGGYLDYRLYPKEKVFVDNRPGEYPASFFKEVYIPMQLDKTIFEKTDQKYKFNTIFFAYSDQTSWAKSFVRQISGNPNWKIVYLDDYIIILLKNNKQNKKLIRQFAMDQNSLKISHYNKENYTSLLRLAIFFNVVQWRDLEVKTYHDILALKPDLCPILYNLYLIPLDEKSPTSNIWASKYNNKCK